MLHEKDTCLLYESWNKKAECHLVWPQKWNVHVKGLKYFATVCMGMSTNDCGNILSTDFRWYK